MNCGQLCGSHQPRRVSDPEVRRHALGPRIPPPSPREGKQAPQVLSSLKEPGGNLGAALTAQCGNSTPGEQAASSRGVQKGFRSKAAAAMGSRRQALLEVSVGGHWAPMGAAEGRQPQQTHQKAPGPGGAMYPLLSFRAPEHIAMPLVGTSGQQDLSHFSHCSVWPLKSASGKVSSDHFCLPRSRSQALGQMAMEGPHCQPWSLFLTWLCSEVAKVSGAHRGPVGEQSQHSSHRDLLGGGSHVPPHV